MKAEQILEVLMDDKKYKARVDELRALEAKLSVVRQIAATVEVAKALEESFKQAVFEVKKRQVQIEVDRQQQIKDIADKAKEQALTLDERASREREQYKDARDVRAQGIAAMEYANKLKDELDSQRANLIAMDNDVKRRERDLAARIKRVSEAFNG